jgi:hypothetical protein
MSLVSVLIDYSTQKILIKFDKCNVGHVDYVLEKYNGWILKFSLEVGFERVFIFSVTLDTRKNERQMSVSTKEVTLTSLVSTIET